MDNKIKNNRITVNKVNKINEKTNGETNKIKQKIDISKVKILDTSSESDEEIKKYNENENENKNVNGETNKKKNKPNKISDTNYDRPELTYTDLLTKKDIEGLLLDYEKVDVDKLDKILIGTHIRYFENKDGELKFRVGGILKVKGLPDYIILNNGKVGWSVQVKKCIFFKKISIESVRNEYKQLLIDKDIELDKLRSYIKIKEKEILALKKELKKK
jgi:hypothetical protein